MCDFDESLLRPGAFARTPFGTPFFALVTDPETDTSELGKLEVGGRLRQELAAWERIQRTRKLKVLMDNKRTDQIAEEAPNTGHRVHRRGSHNFFEFVDRDDNRPDTATATTEESEAGADIDSEIDGFVLINRNHATGTVFWNQRTHSTRSSRVRVRPRCHHHKYQLELELVDEDEEGVDPWAAFMDLLRPVGEMDW
ncbi:hypothetical protein GSI_00154 [Ganoderma sinense ZZ0214-1]|uniref:Uncharacterized protein n=1 Tax=Ganoderma sinense ZZ0214-1 TaxID=1077348 RepID=A0A2G8SRR5_9APHY|nr:hypothetical protein GSI_00154 [Ganoderma sinense ZZ0214-1]